MDRVGALIHKLKEQYDQNVDKKTLMVTVQLLMSELEQHSTAQAGTKQVSVILPRVHRIQQDLLSIDETAETPPSFIPVPEAVSKPIQAAPPAEKEIPDTIRSYVLKPPQQSSHPAPQPAPPAQQPVQPPAPPKQEEETQRWMPEHPAGIPTLAHQKQVYELNDVHIDGDSLNEKLKEEKSEIASTIKGDPVHDLRRAIGINDRYRFINELFRGDEAMYERSIKTINGFSTLAEAETWIQRELKVKIGWTDQNATAIDFDQVVKRRFS